jgi:hypothetical protein
MNFDNVVVCQVSDVSFDVRGASMRRAVRNLLAHCLEERDYFDREGLGSTAEAFEFLAILFEDALQKEKRKP